MLSFGFRVIQLVTESDRYVPVPPKPTCIITHPKSTSCQHGSLGKFDLAGLYRAPTDNISKVYDCCLTFGLEVSRYIVVMGE